MTEKSRLELSGASDPIWPYRPPRHGDSPRIHPQDGKNGKWYGDISADKKCSENYGNGKARNVDRLQDRLTLLL